MLLLPDLYFGEAYADGSLVIENGSLTDFLEIAMKNIGRGPTNFYATALKRIMGMKFNTVLFDNMSVKNLKTGVKLIKKYYETEASGNINLKTVKSIAATGVDRISIGSITHSAPAIDLKLEIQDY